MAISTTRLGDWIKQRERMGDPCFAMTDVQSAFPNATTNKLSVYLSRYRAKGVIQAVHKGFFVVIPPHYALQERVPGFYYVAQLMSHLGRPYYISLLSAASLWGAAHQAVMQTHLMTTLPQSSVSRNKNNTLRWFYRKEIPSGLLVSKNGETGPIVYSNAELTAVDLVHWAPKIGGLSAIATILAELREATNFSGASTKAFPTADVSDIQRLGYIMEVVLGDATQGEIIHRELKLMGGALRNVRLVANSHDPILFRDSRWHVDVNTGIEIDEL